ncbi:MAG: hypothetical protein AMK72_03575 [Planctomycetes bacterium SM23_25]|nr:MAG: hypothetical protein AMS14_04840 [Planctomycetes bacterium DG_20]KPK49844.1 MAG: hypothetical protein AMK72_03575 [Planctomycetes bacterium SM23_25]
MGDMPDLHDTSSERLMARFQERLDAKAMEELASRFMGPALGVAQQILPDRGLAEDAVQEAFLRVVRNHRQYDPQRPFSHWFYAIVRNVCRDLLRRQARHVELVRQVAAQSKAEIEPGTTDLPAATDLLHGLPRGERDVLTLRVAGGMRFEEIGIALGISKEAAKKRAQRGLRRLRERRVAPLEL